MGWAQDQDKASNIYNTDAIHTIHWMSFIVLHHGLQPGILAVEF